MDNKENQNEVQDLISVLDDTKIDKQIQGIKKINPIEELQLCIFKFFEKRLQYIQEKEKFANVVQEKLQEKIETDEMDSKELMALYKLVIQQNTYATESITGLFKPAPGAPSPFTENISKSKEEKDDYEKAFDNYSSDDLQKIDKLYRVLEKLVKKEE